MGLFDLFKKKESTTSKEDKWDSFCVLDNKYKEDEKFKPIYFLKLYGINEVNNNTKIKERAKRDFIRAILNSTKNNDDPIIKCLVDYLITRNEIFDNNKLIDILNDLDVDKLDKISNEHTFYSYIQTREKIKTINNDNLKDIILSLIKALKNSDNLYNVYISKYSIDFHKYIYNIYDNLIDTINSNKKFEVYKFNNNTNNLYLYENGIVVAFNEDLNNTVFVYNKFNLVENIYKIKRLLFINDELFSKNCIELILENEVPLSLEKEFYSLKPYYIYKHNNYGNIEFYYNTEGIEIRCNYFDSKLLNLIQIYNYNCDTDDIRLLYVHTIEKIIELKDRILDMIYTETVNKCSEWNEKNEYGNQITIEYLKNVLRFDISILSEINNNSKEEIKFIISSYSDDLLGGHSIDACVENDKINCIFQ